MLAFVAFLGGIRLSMIFSALRLAPMTIVHTMLSGSPVLVMILSALMFKQSDKCTALKVVASGLFVAGITLSNIKDLTNITPVSFDWRGSALLGRAVTSTACQKCLHGGSAVRSLTIFC